MLHYFYLTGALSKQKYTTSKEKEDISLQQLIWPQEPHIHGRDQAALPAAILRQLLALLHQQAGAHRLIERLKRAVPPRGGRVHFPSYSCTNFHNTPLITRQFH